MSPCPRLNLSPAAFPAVNRCSPPFRGEATGSAVWSVLAVSVSHSPLLTVLFCRGVGAAAPLGRPRSAVVQRCLLRHKAMPATCPQQRHLPCALFASSICVLIRLLLCPRLCRGSALECPRKLSLPKARIRLQLLFAAVRKQPAPQLGSPEISPQEFCKCLGQNDFHPKQALREESLEEIEEGFGMGGLAGFDGGPSGRGVLVPSSSR